MRARLGSKRNLNIALCAWRRDFTGLQTIKICQENVPLLSNVCEMDHHSG
jgi:hypothetical protein